MKAEYDFSRGVRGKYFRRYHRVANMLEPDMARAFPNAGAVNDSLRALASIVQRQGKASAGKSEVTTLSPQGWHIKRQRHPKTIEKSQ